MSTSTATIVTVFTVVGSVGGLLALQAFWISRMFDSFRNEVVIRFESADATSKIRFDAVGQRLEQIESRLGRVEGLNERITRLEGTRS